MAFYDPATGEIVVRIVYDGLGTAGKTTNLRALFAAFPARAPRGIETPAQSNDGRTLFFDLLELSAGHLDERPLSCQIVSVPGQFAYASRRFRLLQQLDGVVLVCDSRPPGVASAKIALEFLRHALTSAGNPDAPLILQANKQDLPDALAPTAVKEALRGIADDVIGTSAITGDGVRWTLLSILDRVRDRVRKTIATQGLSALPVTTPRATELYEALVASDVEDAHATALEAALEAMK
ncbi:MAG: hypothetical protein U0271_06330 [Polyangiaceae bacterium]